MLDPVYTIRRINKDDDVAIAAIIRTVMPEFGANRAGFAIHDPEVDHMAQAYGGLRSAYFVFEQHQKIMGGGGIAPLQGGTNNICELKKMYFLPEARGQGFGQRVLSSCMQAARDLGYEWCYLETFNTMLDAMRLYEKNKFERIPNPLGNTGHFACDIFYKVRL